MLPLSPTALLPRPQTPLTELRHALLQKAGVRLLLKRDDLLHPLIGGNKWRKLRYNLPEARRQGKHLLVTFGGAYSNHIAAVAEAGKQLGFATAGFIRGEEHLPLNPTLRHATQNGMQLHYISRELYRQKTEPGVLAELLKPFGREAYLLPEGGSNLLAVQGCAELVEELPEAWDFLCCPVGTGASLAGLVAGAAGKGRVLGFAALKGAGFLEQEVQRLLRLSGCGQYQNWEIVPDYHFGGYAKVKPGLLQFLDAFAKDHEIPLDPVYTGKMLFGVFDLIQKQYFPAGSTIIAWHTGGLQGLAGMRERGILA